MQNGKRGSPLQSIGTLWWAVQKRLNRSRCRLGVWLRWAQGTMYYVVCTLPPPGEYHWTVHVRWRWGMLSNYFDHLFGRNAAVTNCHCEQYFSAALGHLILIIGSVCPSVCATEVRALYGRLSCGWLRVVCTWRPWLRWEVGVAG